MRRASFHHKLLRYPGARTFVLCMCFFALTEGLLFNPSLVQAGREEAPDFRVSSLNGEHFSNFKLEGERALLMFWAPWCGVCRRELPKLTHFYKHDMPDDLQILTLGTSASLEEVEQYVASHPGTFTFPTAYDAGKVIARDFEIRAFPTYVLLDRDGTILLVHRGSGILKDQKFQQVFP